MLQHIITLSLFHEESANIVSVCLKLTVLKQDVWPYLFVDGHTPCFYNTFQELCHPQRR